MFSTTQINTIKHAISNISTGGENAREAALMRAFEKVEKAMSEMMRVEAAVDAACEAYWALEHEGLYTKARRKARQEHTACVEKRTAMRDNLLRDIFSDEDQDHLMDLHERLRAAVSPYRNSRPVFGTRDDLEQVWRFLDRLMYYYTSPHMRGNY